MTPLSPKRGGGGKGDGEGVGGFTGKILGFRDSGFRVLLVEHGGFGGGSPPTF